MIAVCAAVAVACGSKATNPGINPTPTPIPTPTPTPTAWSDEFDGPPNSAPDPSKWTFDLGGGGWGNQELETYTNSVDNAPPPPIRSKISENPIADVLLGPFARDRRNGAP